MLAVRNEVADFFASLPQPRANNALDAIVARFETCKIVSVEKWDFLDNTTVEFKIDGFRKPVRALVYQHHIGNGVYKYWTQSSYVEVPGKYGYSRYKTEELGFDGAKFNCIWTQRSMIAQNICSAICGILNSESQYTKQL